MWEPGTATALGPFPGADPLEAARIATTELTVLPCLPELPARGVGADPVGRTAGLLADLHVEVGTGAWRFVTRPGRDEHRARAALVTDLDAFEEAASGWDGPVKIRLVGPWSLAASIELARGEKAVADEGAVRDVAASLAEGLTRHLADLRRRLPAVSRIVVQVDEPLLAAVVAGELATASGWGRLRSYERPVVEDGLRQVLAAAPEGDAGVWIGAAPLDGALLRAAGAAFIGLDGAVLDSVDEDEVGEAIDAGLGLLVAAVPLEDPHRDPRPALAPVRSLWKRLGFAAGLLPATVAVAPVEGLEQLTLSAVPAVLARAAEAARYLEESAAEEEG
ncbi:MAG TPA: methionine synthase [Acidimicrobiia bacterium]|nr:methionine synthase [Acidimicrobiia bacterium]